MNKQQALNKLKKTHREARTRKKARFVSAYPRLSVFRSNKHIYAQIIDDTMHKTLVSVSENEKASGTKTDRAREIGKEIAKVALEKKIKQVAFDKGSYAYHGRVKALAEGAREGGLVI